MPAGGRPSREAFALSAANEVLTRCGHVTCPHGVGGGGRRVRGAGGHAADAGAGARCAGLARRRLWESAWAHSHALAARLFVVFALAHGTPCSGAVVPSHFGQVCAVLPVLQCSSTARRERTAGRLRLPDEYLVQLERCSDAGGPMTARLTQVHRVKQAGPEFVVALPPLATARSGSMTS